jgi:hypothetical protein
MGEAKRRGGTGRTDGERLPDFVFVRDKGAEEAEDAGALSWVHRIKRAREPCPDLLGNAGWQTRVIRSSNAYNFRDPSPAADRPKATESEKPTGTRTKSFPLPMRRAAGAAKKAFDRVGAADLGLPS